MNQHEFYRALKAALIFGTVCGLLWVGLIAAAIHIIDAVTSLYGGVPTP